MHAYVPVYTQLEAILISCQWMLVVSDCFPTGSSNSVERNAISWIHSKGVASWETDQESLGFCSNLDYIKWETKCPFLRVTEGNLQGFFLQCLHGQFTMPVTFLPLLSDALFLKPHVPCAKVASHTAVVPCCRVPSAPA